MLFMYNSRLCIPRLCDRQWPAGQAARVVASPAATPRAVAAAAAARAKRPGEVLAVVASGAPWRKQKRNRAGLGFFVTEIFLGCFFKRNLRK